MVEGRSMRRKTNQRRQARMARAMALLREGYNQPEVAEILDVSVKTIQNYEKEIREAGDTCSRGHHPILVTETESKSVAMSGDPRGFLVKIRRKRTCPFCGHSEIVPKYLEREGGNWNRVARLKPVP